MVRIEMLKNTVRVSAPGSFDVRVTFRPFNVEGHVTPATILRLVKWCLRRRGKKEQREGSTV